LLIKQKASLGSHLKTNFFDFFNIIPSSSSIKKKAADRKWSVEIISVANKLNKIKTGEFDFGAESCGEEIQIRSSS
jgi:hypothetical protein